MLQYDTAMPVYFLIMILLTVFKIRLAFYAKNIIKSKLYCYLIK